MHTHWPQVCPSGLRNQPSCPINGKIIKQVQASPTLDLSGFSSGLVLLVMCIEKIVLWNSTESIGFEVGLGMLWLLSRSVGCFGSCFKITEALNFKLSTKVYRRQRSISITSSLFISQRLFVDSFCRQLRTSGFEFCEERVRSIQIRCPIFDAHMNSPI